MLPTVNNYRELVSGTTAARQIENEEWNLTSLRLCYPESLGHFQQADAKLAPSARLQRIQSHNKPKNPFFRELSC